MRITPKVVETVAKHTEDFTGKAFQFHGMGGDIGHGARYFDGIRQLVWVGKGASQEAAAYYVGGLLGWARHTGALIPDDIREYGQEVQASYQYNRKAMEWQAQGESDAESRALRAAEKNQD